MTAAEINGSDPQYLAAVILGWKHLRYSDDVLLVGWPPGGRAFKRVPAFASRVEDAWKIVEWLGDHRARVTIRTVPGERPGNCWYNIRIERGGRAWAIEERQLCPALCRCLAVAMADGGAA